MSIFMSVVHQYCLIMHFTLARSWSIITSFKLATTPMMMTTDAAIAWLEGREDPSRPFFLFVHTYQVHSPYLPPEPFAAWIEHLMQRGRRRVRDKRKKHKGEL